MVSTISLAVRSRSKAPETLMLYVAPLVAASACRNLPGLKLLETAVVVAAAAADATADVMPLGLGVGVNVGVFVIVGAV